LPQTTFKCHKQKTQRKTEDDRLSNQTFARDPRLYDYYSCCIEKARHNEERMAELQQKLAERKAVLNRVHSGIKMGKQAHKAFQ